MNTEYFRAQVREYYNEAVKLHPTAPSHLKTALKSHERVPAFIDNISLELTKVSAMRLKKGKPMPAPKHVKEIVYDMVDVFISGLIQEANKKHESDLTRLAREVKAQDKADLEKSASGNLSGDYADLAKEAGLTIDESRSI